MERMQSFAPAGLIVDCWSYGMRWPWGENWSQNLPGGRCSLKRAKAKPAHGGRSLFNKWTV